MPSSTDPMGMHGRKVLVTGGTQGIGFAIAESFLACGAQVTVCAHGAVGAS